MDTDQWIDCKYPLKPLIWKRTPYVGRSIESFPCKIWIKEQGEKDPRLIYYVIEDQKYLDSFLSNSSKQLRYAVELKPVNL